MAQPAAAATISADETSLHSLPQLADAQPRRSLLLIGGIHGNEIHAIEGASLVLHHLRSMSPLTMLLRERTSLFIMPVANRIGALAGARCCPVDPLQQVQWDGQRVVVADDEKGGIKPPKGWSDPNRGWGENVTLAKGHIERAINSIRPQAVIFTHGPDWAAPQGIVGCYTDEARRTAMAPIKEIFSRLYPSKHIFGTAWQFVRTPTEAENGESLSWALMQRGTPNYVLENYLYNPRSARCHLALCLFILCKEAQLDLTDAQLMHMILAETGV